MALGLGADVTVLDTDVDVLSRLALRYSPALKTVYSSISAREELIAGSDLVVGAVLVAGAEAPKVITREMVKAMKSGTVLVDVAIDQGGCFETSQATTHKDPTYAIDDVIHYCVANMPGAVPCTSTYALNNATTPFGMELADKGWRQALKEDGNLRNGLNVCAGNITNKAVADALNYEYLEPASLV